MVIEHKETFISMLEKMYWIEASMENLGIWEARIEMMNERKESIEILSTDSDKHRIILEKWMKKANIKIPKNAPLGLPKKEFDFSGMDTPEMFKELMKYEILAKNVYAEMLETDPEVLAEIFSDDSQATDFLTDIQKIRKDEERHENICRQNVGGFQTIMVKRF